MAENKKAFLLYADLIHTVRKMPKDKAGDLFITILSYVNDENPVVDDILIDLVFEPIKQQLKRDLQNWSKIKDKKSEGGKRGMESRWGKKDITIDNIVIKDITPITVNVNDNVNVNESVINDHPLKNSNLFRKPTIPTFETVYESFKRNGGNKDQATKFYDKHNSTGWYLNGSPIVNFNNLIASFISNWNKNEAGKFKTTTDVTNAIIKLK